MLAQGCSRVDASHQAVLLGQMRSPCLQVPAWGDSREVRGPAKLRGPAGCGSQTHSHHSIVKVLDSVQRQTHTPWLQLVLEKQSLRKLIALKALQ